MKKGKYSDLAISLARESLTSDVSPSGKPWVQAFESEFSQRVGDEYGIAVNSATSGLHAALLACGVGPGDEVIGPGLTVVMDAYATVFANATPVFADVEPDSWNIDPKSVRTKITARTKAIISVSWLGLPSNLAELRKLCDEFGLFLIDDSAETIPERDLLPPGWKSADLRVFSFESKKHMPTGGEGGMVTTSNPDLAEKVRKYAGLGYKHLTPTAGRTSLASNVSQKPNYLRFDRVGPNYRMTPTTAAIGLGQMVELDAKLRLRKRNAELLFESLSKFDFITFQTSNFSDFHTYYAFGFCLDEEFSMSDWERIYSSFSEQTGFGFYANQAVPYKEVSLLDYAPSQPLKVAESLQPRIIAMKTNLLTEEDMHLQAGSIQNSLREIERVAS